MVITDYPSSNRKSLRLGGFVVSVGLFDQEVFSAMVMVPVYVPAGASAAAPGVFS